MAGTGENQTLDAQNILSDLVKEAQAQGADEADAVLFESTSLAVSYRLGALEDIERSEGSDLGLRVFIGKCQAFVATTDMAPAARSALVERAVAMARHAPEDPYCGLADQALLAAGSKPELDLCDETDVSEETLIEWARAAEDAARGVSGITNSEGSSAESGRSSIALVTSQGFAGGYSTTGHGVSVSVLAGEGTEMERDYEYSSARHAGDLEDRAALGREAGERTVRRLGARSVKPCQVPVVYDPRVASSLLGHFSGAINGAGVARGTSFLKDRMGSKVFAAGVSVVDDPLRQRGLRSKPFDGEGVATQSLNLIDDGTLTTWLMDSASARQLGLATTGRASRGTSGPPSPSATNLYMEAGSCTPEELIGDIESGFYVSELIGMGVNGVTGDYSRGASGFWIENGEICYPVSGLTIAGNLKDMFLAISPASDLEFTRGVNAPTLRVEGMTVAGS